MAVIDVQKDPAALTMSITCEFDARVENVWQLWADPRRLERWWGPPGYPATFVDHDLTPGGWVRYFMTGPEGDKYGGWWRITAAEPPHRLEFEDGFADDSGQPNPDMPVTTIAVTIEGAAAGVARMTIHSRFASAEAMEQLVAMGMEEGIKQSLGQIDEILAADAA